MQATVPQCPESPPACGAPPPTPRHASCAASLPHALHVRAHDKAQDTQTGTAAGTPLQATSDIRAGWEEQLAPHDPSSPPYVRRAAPSRRTPKLGVRRARRQNIPRGCGAHSSKRPRLEGAAPLPLLASRRARALPATRVVRIRSRVSELHYGASAAQPAAPAPADPCQRPRLTMARFFSN